MNVEQVSSRTDQVTSIIQRAAQNNQQDFNYMLAQARIESGLNPAAKAKTSSAAGLYQFTSGTWMDLVKRHGDKVGLDETAHSLRSGNISASQKDDLLAKRHDPALSSELAARFAIENAQSLQRSGHEKIGAAELYVAHFLGPQGANTFLNGVKTQPNAPAAQALPQAANANARIFYADGKARSYADIFGQFQKKFAGPALAPLTAAGPAPAPLTLAGPAPAPLTPAGRVPAPVAPASRAPAPMAPASPALGPVTPASPAPQNTKGPAAAAITKAAQAVVDQTPRAPRQKQPEPKAILPEPIGEKMPAPPLDKSADAPLSESAIQGVAAKALRQAKQEATGEASNISLDEASLGSFLRGFSLQQADPSITPIINEAETRDASAGANSDESGDLGFGANQQLSGHAIGGKLIIKTIERGEGGDEARAEEARRPAPAVSSRAVFSEWAALWGGASKGGSPQSSK